MHPLHRVQQVLRPPSGGRSCFRGLELDYCYVDESGNDETLLASRPDSTPAFVLGGLLVPGEHQKNLLWDFLMLKKSVRPMLRTSKTSLSDLVRTEIKGADLRADIRLGGRNRRRAAFHVLDRSLDLLEQYDCRLIGLVKIKTVGEVLQGNNNVYSGAVAVLAQAYHHWLNERKSEGIMVLDARTKVKNVGHVHGITTRKFRTGGDPLPRLREAPLFGHSDAHVPLQVIDVVVSSLLFPLACYAYSSDLTWSTHCNTNFAAVRPRYGPRLEGLEHKHVAPHGGTPWRGFHVVDTRSQRSPKLLLEGPAPTA